MKISPSAGSLRPERPISLVVGLGNPGPAYEGTRHNLGARVVEALGRRHNASFRERRFGGRYARLRFGGRWVDLLLPETYMNRSGESVARAAETLGLSPPEILVVYDDLDLPLGRIRLREAGGAGSHQGVASVVAAIGREFPRLRLGIGPKPPAAEWVDFVLGEFKPEEAEDLARTVETAVAALQTTLLEGLPRAMNLFNAHKSQPGQEP